MLELKNIKKDYPTGGGKVEALKGIDLRFREKEFVAILGPSGCGKTTLLNIIGGLDHYTEGDLSINGISTKQYSDRDWDTYRNHSIGFVFQNYYLIPHQTVLKNVELALTLAGASKSERRKLAQNALEEVGLGDQIKKKPSQLSGGQMQRVAIARALVNNPDIVLADEPTGALDTETSVQIMEMLKKASEKHLVVMVTHNPELAETYATRIIRMLDGKIVDDSLPVTDEELSKEKTEAAAETGRAEADGSKRKKKPSMSLLTAMMRSAKNLFSKKGRTILTSFAGSIGIIGIALIYSVSNGTNRFIDKVQEETLASYPITIEKKHTDLNELLANITGSTGDSHDHELDGVYQRIAMYKMVNVINNTSVTENDLKSFNQYLLTQTGSEDSEFGKSISGLSYTYDLDILAYTKNREGEIIRSDTTELMTDILSKAFGADMSSLSTMSGRSGSTLMSLFTSSSTTSAVMWQEMLAGMNGETVSNIVKSQYEIVYGDWPTAYDQVVLVIDKNNEISDMVLYALGMKSKKAILDAAEAALSGVELEVPDENWSYEEMCDREFKLILNSDCFVKDEATGKYSDLRDSETGLRYLYNNGIPLKIVGVIRPAKDAIPPMLRGNIGYTSKLTEFIIERTAESDSAKQQLDNPDTDIFTGLPFKSNISLLGDEEKARVFKSYVSGLDTLGKATTFIKIMSSPTEEQISQTVSGMLAGMTREDMIEALLSGAAGQGMVNEDEIRQYIGGMTDDDIKQLVTKFAAEQFKKQYADRIKAEFAGKTNEELAAQFDAVTAHLTDEQCALLYDTALEFSDATYEDNLAMLGSVDVDNPKTINIYTATFADKDEIQKMIDKYNESRDELSKISYTDYVGILMRSVTTIINSISYVLISFVAISLIVSSIMIGVITLISVQERTKEIGILRALGASKKNVSSMFVAETVTIGFVSGLFGVIVSWLFTIPINLVVHALTGLKSLSAYLPVGTAAILVLISMVLTLVAGLIPSGSAARKDPVEALRTE